MSDTAKGKVNWTLDQDVIEAVKHKAQQLSKETGVKISDSAAANKVLKENLVKEKVNGQKTR